MGQSGAYLQPGKRDVEEEEGRGNGETVEGGTKKRAMGVKHPRQFQDTPCRYPGVLAAQGPFSSSSSSSAYSFPYGRLVFLPHSFPIFLLVSSTAFISLHRTPIVHFFFTFRQCIPFLVPFSIGFLFCRIATFATLFLLFGILRAVPATLQSRSVRVPFSFTLRSDHVQDQISPNRDPRNREVPCSNCTQLYGLLQVRKLSLFFI